MKKRKISLDWEGLFSYRLKNSCTDRKRCQPPVPTSGHVCLALTNLPSFRYSAPKLVRWANRCIPSPPSHQKRGNSSIHLIYSDRPKCWDQPAALLVVQLNKLLYQDNFENRLCSLAYSKLKAGFPFCSVFLRLFLTTEEISQSPFLLKDIRGS